MWLSSTAQQAIQAVLYIASREPDDTARVDEIAAEIDCPRNYLSKVLHALVRHGVLRSARGPKGGFQLLASPAKTTLAQVVKPFEPVGERRCVLGRPRCGEKDPCRMHARWVEVAQPVDTFFAATTIASLLAGDSHASRATREPVAKKRPATRR